MPGLSDLKNALRRVAEGGELSDAELKGLYPPGELSEDPGLGHMANDALYIGLAHFVADADIRAHDKNYDRLQREDIRSRLEQLEALERGNKT